MVSAHTPGPWEVSGFGTIHSTVPIEGGCRMEPACHRIADVRGWGHLQYRPDGEKIMEANGRLIAAAPDLLAAAEDALWLFDQPASDDLASDAVRITKALRASVAKARTP